MQRSTPTNAPPSRGPDPRSVAAGADFPASGTLTEKLQFLLNFAVLAPSIHNTQPWFFRVEGDTVELYADWSWRAMRSSRCCSEAPESGLRQRISRVL